MKSQILLALGLAALPSQVFAHASFLEAKAVAGAGFKAVLAVPHGCDGKATRAVHLKLPEGFIGAKPMPKPGWTLEIVEGDFRQSYDLHGKAVSSGPTEIRWSGGLLEDGWYDEFVVYGTFASQAPAGSFAFPALQDCGDGARIAWDEVAADGADLHSLVHPAPTIDVAMPASDGAHAGHHGDSATTATEPAAVVAQAGTAATTAGTATLGDITIAGGFARAMLPGQKVGGGYLSISNGAAVDDRLVSISTPAAAKSEVHEMTMDGDVMRMRPMPDGIAVPAGGTVELKPGGLHLMFTTVAAPFAAGQTVPVTLTFEKAGTVDVLLPVEAAAATGGDHGSHVMPGQ